MNLNLTRDNKVLGNGWDDLRSAIKTEIINIIARIEDKYGPIDTTYSLKTVNFDSSNKIFTMVDEKSRTITINLPQYIMNEDDDALYQRKLNLSHELIHTITPCGDSNRVTFLEEGLATVFSEDYTGCESSSAGNYQIARVRVMKLLKMDTMIIQKLRMKHPHKKLSDYTVLDIAGELSSPNLSLIQELVKPFYSRNWP